MITQLSERLGIQFIMINHNPALAGIATETIEVVKENGCFKNCKGIKYVKTRYR